MSGGRGKNTAASVRDRLLAVSRTTGDNFQLLLTRYATERLLFRLGRSEHADRFVLKGAMLFAIWTGQMHRPTRDLDLLGFGDDAGEALAEVFRALCQLRLDDGLEFDPGTVRVEPIREDEVYGGQRVVFQAILARARIDIQVDVGFGDAVTPAPEVVDYPSLLGMEAPRLRAYPRETVVAEKLEAMVTLGLANSRMKDFYDLLVLARTFPFGGALLVTAITATFSRRQTALGAELPVSLSSAFAEHDSKQKQWAAFLRRSGLAGQSLPLGVVIAELARFLLPPLGAATRGEHFLPSWRPGGPWE